MLFSLFLTQGMEKINLLSVFKSRPVGKNIAAMLKRNLKKGWAAPVLEMNKIHYPLPYTTNKPTVSTTISPSGCLQDQRDVVQPGLIDNFLKCRDSNVTFTDIFMPIQVTAKFTFRLHRKNKERQLETCMCDFSVSMPWLYLWSH